MYNRARSGPPSSDPSARLLWSDQQAAATALVHVLLVGDAGLGHHNVGNNFVRAAQTRQQELEAAGHTVAVESVSSLGDVQAALAGAGTISGGVEYYGHGWTGILYVGEGAGGSTNIDASNVSGLVGTSFLAGAVMILYSCQSGAGGAASIAQLLANQLVIPVTGSTRPLGFTGRRGVYLHGEHARPPSSGNLYMTPPNASDWVLFNPP